MQGMSTPAVTPEPPPLRSQADKAREWSAAPPAWVVNFYDARRERRRLFSELFGTFLLVLVAAGGGMVAAVGGQKAGDAQVVAPALMVMAVILFMGKVSGAHLNPVVSLGFAMRGDFPWRRVPGYVVAQLGGAALASLLLVVLFGHVGHLGATLPGPGFNSMQAFWVEVLLTLGLVSTILGTASGAQNVGALSALAVAGYIALAGLWAGPVSGASMNPARSLGPALVGWSFRDLWIYLTGPLVGALVAVAAARLLRGQGGRDPVAAAAAQGVFDAELGPHTDARPLWPPSGSA